MARYLVTEYQRIRYQWVVEAPDEGTALLSADGGVPDFAHEELRGSDVEAARLSDADEPDTVWCAACDEFHDEPCAESPA